MAGNNAVQTYLLYDGLGSTTGLTDGSGNDWRFTGQLHEPAGAWAVRRVGAWSG